MSLTEHLSTSVPPFHPVADVNLNLEELNEFIHDEAFVPVEMDARDSDAVVIRAFDEWNSRAGIPLDVFYSIITATVYCSSCERNRSLAGDRAHKTDLELCRDKGKQRDLAEKEGDIGSTK
jgi:hypothetical protein